MSTATIASAIQREPELLDQTAVVIGGRAGITARLDESHTPIPPRHLASCQIEGSR
jgi:hypothetical protein